MDHGSHSERRVGIGLESADRAVAGKPFNGSGVLQSGRCRSNFAAQEPCCGPIWADGNEGLPRCVVACTGCAILAAARLRMVDGSHSI